MPHLALLPRSAPAASGVSSPAISALLDRLEEKSIECHSLMVVRHGHVVAEGWWAPYSADRAHLLYSLTKSFTSIAVGLAIADGLLSLDDRVTGVLPDHVPAGISEQGRRISVHHRHAYDNSAAFILARMVERVAGRGLAEFLDERL